MHGWCLVFWPAPSGAMLERAGYTLQKPVNDELRTSQKGSLNLAPWLCAPASPGSLSCLRDTSGTMGESYWGTLWHHSREVQADAFLWAHLVFICIGICPLFLAKEWGVDSLLVDTVLQLYSFSILVQNVCCLMGGRRLEFIFPSASTRLLLQRSS